MNIMKRLALLVLAIALTGCEMDSKSDKSSKKDDASTQIEFLTSEGQDSSLPFSEAVRVGKTLYMSGQIGVVPGTTAVVEGGMEAEARQTMENLKATLERYGSSLDRVVKCTVMIDDISQWGDFNEVYVEYFPGHKPARSAFGADGLALGAALELECIAILP